MAKIEVTFSRKVKIGGRTFEGTIEIDKPLMGDMSDAADICSPKNPIGFGMAVIGVVLDIPYNLLREVDPDDFMVVQKAMSPIIPKQS